MDDQKNIQIPHIVLNEDPIQDNQKDCQEEITIKIKCVNGPEKVFKLDKFSNHSILKLKNELFQTELQNKQNVKLIFRGRLLKDSEILKNLDLKGSCFLHASISQLPNSQTNNQQLDEEQQIPPQLNQDLTNQQNLNSTNVAYQLNHAQIQEQIRDFALQDQQTLEEIQQLNNQQLLEEQGTSFDFCLGVIIGFSFQIIGLIFVVCAKFPTKTKNGALIGIFINLMYSLLTYHQPNAEK